MSEDEIDIVEHDLLDNPHLQKMFPDLSILKKELIDFEDEVKIISESFNDNESQKQKHKVIEEESNVFPSNPTNKIITICLDNITLQEIDWINKNTSSEVATKGKQFLLNNTAGSSLFGKINVGKRNIDSEIKLHPSRSAKVLKKASVSLKKKRGQYQERRMSQESILLKENSNSAMESSAKSDLIHMENHQLTSKIIAKQEQNNGRARNKTYLSFKNNKIVLGTKPSISYGIKNDYDLSNVKVILENIDTFLRKSTRYCKICLRLFPSNNTLFNHITQIHSQSDENQSAGLCMDRSSINPNNRYKCNFCFVVCSSQSDLLIHEKKNHSINKTNNRRKTGNFDHKILPQNGNLKTESKNVKCTHCNNSFTSQELLIDHMYNVLQTKTNNPDTKIITESSVVNEDKITKYPDFYFYRCPFCSYYYKFKKFYFKHVEEKHKNNTKLKAQKVVFDPICKFCSKKYCNIMSFNVHMWKFHQKEINKEISNKAIKKLENVRSISKYKNDILEKKKIQSTLNMDEKDVKHFTIVNSQIEAVQNRYMLKSALFKCIKCNIYFLSGSKAADHIVHMKILIERKCLKCLRIFKKEDELLHIQQHLYTNTFDVYELNDIRGLFVLYKCPNCTTYFREKDFFDHYSVCEIQSPNSAYCKVCHILIDFKIKAFHDSHHRQMKNNSDLNYTFVESEVITYIEENPNIKRFQDNAVLINESDFEKQNSVKK